MQIKSVTQSGTFLDLIFPYSESEKNFVILSRLSKLFSFLNNICIRKPRLEKIQLRVVFIALLFSTNIHNSYLKYRDFLNLFPDSYLDFWNTIYRLTPKVFASNSNRTNLTYTWEELIINYSNLPIKDRIVKKLTIYSYEC